jgi:hypothetical protein
MQLVFYSILVFALGMVASWGITVYFPPMDPFEKFARELKAIHKRLDHMANELTNLQTAAAAAIALLQKLAAGQGGVAPADVQAVADQLNAAVTANTPPTP